MMMGIGDRISVNCKRWLVMLKDSITISGRNAIFALHTKHVSIRFSVIHTHYGTFSQHMASASHGICQTNPFGDTSIVEKIGST